VAASNNRDHPTRSLSSSRLASTINSLLASQALLEVTHQGHSIRITRLIPCKRHVCMGVILPVHPVRGK